MTDQPLLEGDVPRHDPERAATRQGELMTDLRLYLVKADLTHIHDFDAAVVYATSPEDAVAVTMAAIDKFEADYANGVVSPVEGMWETLYDGATLTATEVPVVRGPVLGHSTPC